MRVKHAGHAPDLIAVPVQHGFEIFLRVVEDEPGALAEVGSLAGGLEVQPGLRKVLVGRGGVGEGLRGVVGGEEVFDYGAGFPEGEVSVWVVDGGDAAVGVCGFEGFCFVRG